MESQRLAQEVTPPDEYNIKSQLKRYFTINHGGIESADEGTAIEYVFPFGDTDAIVLRKDVDSKESFILLGNNTYTQTKFGTKPRLSKLTSKEVIYLSEKTGLPLHELVEIHRLSKK